MAEPAKILLFTTGTRGDAEPFAALALGLKARGHTVILATHARYSAWLEGLGIDVAPLSDRSLDLFESEDGRLLLERQAGFTQQYKANRRFQRARRAQHDENIAECVRTVQDIAPDIMVSNGRIGSAPHVAEGTGTPLCIAALQPIFVPTRDFAPFMIAKLPLPGWNRFAYRIMDLGVLPFRGRINRLRRQTFGLGPLRRARDIRFPPGLGHLPILHAISPTVIPRPGDWPEHVHMSGFWRLKDGAEAFTPPPELERFLAAGPPPVYVGFGSMRSNEAADLSRVVVEALRAAGVRGVIGAGWAGLEAPEGDDLITIGSVPHGWLFPRMAAVVHHGGAGTTSAGLHAGVPSVICPFFADQPDWAARCIALGVSAAPVPRAGITVERLSASIKQAVSDPELATRAKEVAEALAQEDGVAAAINVIEARLAEGRP